MNQLAVHEYGRKFSGQIHPQFHSRSRDRRTRRIQNFVQQRTKVGLFQLKLDRFGEIEKCFHRAIEPVNFAVQHLDGLLRFGFHRHISLEDFQPQPHGIKWIFHLVRDTRGDSPQRSEPLGNVKLIPDALDGFNVAQSHERAHAHSMLADDLSAQPHALHSIGAFQRHFRIFYWNDLVSFNTQSLANRMPGGKNLAGAAAAKFVGTPAKKILHGWTYEYGAAMGVEEE